MPPHIWEHTASRHPDIGAIAAKWGNHPLATTILIAIYGYLEEKTKAVMP